MADGKLRYDIDFDVHTEAISDAIARAVSGATRLNFRHNNPSLDSIDAAIVSQGERLGINSFYENVRSTHLGLDSLSSQGLPSGSSVSQFAALAASSKYGYTPSTIQTMIRHASDMEALQYEEKTDMGYKLDMEAAIGDLRRMQRQNRLADLAATYKNQGSMFASAASMASTPEEKRILLSRAASRYGSIASRTLMESGAVDSDSAIAALAASAELSAIRSGISTKSQDMERGFRAIEAASATEDKYSVEKDPDVIRWQYGNSLYAAAQYASGAENYAPGSTGRDAKLALARESLRGITVAGMAKSGMSRDELDRNTTALIGLTKLIEKLSSEGGGGGEGGLFGGITSGMVAKGVGYALDAANDVMTGRTKWLADTSAPYQTRRDVRQNWAQSYGKTAAVGGAAIGASIGTAISPGFGTLIGGAIGAIPGAISNLLGTHYADEKKIGDSYQARARDMDRYRKLYRGTEYNYAQLVGNMGYVSMDSMLQLNQAADMLPGAMMFGAVGEQQMMALSYMPNYWAGLMEGRSTSELAALYKQDIEALPREMRQYITSLLPGASEDLRAFTASSSFGTAQGLAQEMRQYDAEQYGKNEGYLMASQYIAAQNSRQINKDFLEETATASAPNYFRTVDEWLQAIKKDAPLSPQQQILKKYWGNFTDLGTANGNSILGLQAMDALVNTGELTKGQAARKLAEMEGDPSGDLAAIAALEERAALNGTDLNAARNSGVPLGNIIINIDGREAYNEAFSVDDFKQNNQTYIIGGI